MGLYKCEGMIKEKVQRERRAVRIDENRRDEGGGGDDCLLSGQLVSQRKLIHPPLDPVANFHSHA